MNVLKLLTAFLRAYARGTVYDNRAAIVAYVSLFGNVGFFLSGAHKRIYRGIAVTKNW
jgi:hypothetical protein